MKSIGTFILEKLRITNTSSNLITIDTFKNGIDVYAVSSIEMQCYAPPHTIDLEYIYVDDNKDNLIGVVEIIREFKESSVYLILDDYTYEYFCKEFDADTENENGTIMPDELKDIVADEFTRPMDFYYIIPVSEWLDTRDHWLTKTDKDYTNFRDTYNDIKNKLSM